MGHLIPQPPTFSGSITIEIGEVQAAQIREYIRRLPWLCPYCRTGQQADRTDCRNCGAPKSALEDDD